MGDDFLEKFEHKRFTLREALKYSAKNSSRLASIAEFVNEMPQGLAGITGPVVSGTMIAFMRKKFGPRSRISARFIDETREESECIVFNIPKQDYTVGTCYLMPPGTYDVKLTKQSIVLTARTDFVPAYQRINVGGKPLFYFTTDLSKLDHEQLIDPTDLRQEYGGPLILLNTARGRRIVAFGNTMEHRRSPLNADSYFIKKVQDGTK